MKTGTCPVCRAKVPVIRGMIQAHQRAGFRRECHGMNGRFYAPPVELPNMLPKQFR